MERNVTSLELVPGRGGGFLSSPRPWPFLQLTSMLRCVRLHLDARTTASVRQGGTDLSPLRPVQGSCLSCALPENLTSSGTFYMEHFGFEKEIN